MNTLVFVLICLACLTVCVCVLFGIGPRVPQCTCGSVWCERGCDRQCSCWLSDDERRYNMTAQSEQDVS